jgi:hypothetical protein
MLGAVATIANDLTTLPAAAVFSRGTSVLTSSRIVAEVFEKRHDNVLRDIDALIHSSELRDGSTGLFQPVLTHDRDSGHGLAGWFQPVLTPHSSPRATPRRVEAIRRGGQVAAVRLSSLW